MNKNMTSTNFNILNTMVKIIIQKKEFKFLQKEDGFMQEIYYIL